MWYIYILRCKDSNLYTGTTTDIFRRVKEHNSKKGGACTRARLPVKLVYKEVYQTRSQALKREHKIKRWSRRKKLALIANNKTALKQ
ncbi:GIY-YIG nuclease family protein [Candidatus Omnitrophota bacterium]